jgi:hypothetical protein
MNEVIDIEDVEAPVSPPMKIDEAVLIALVGRVMIVPAAAFIPSNGSQERYSFNYIDADLKGTGESGLAFLHAPLILPPTARITGIVAYLRRTNRQREIWVRLYRSQNNGSRLPS